MGKKPEIWIEKAIEKNTYYLTWPKRVEVLQHTITFCQSKILEEMHSE